MTARAARSTRPHAGPALLVQLPLAGVAACFACTSVQSPVSTSRASASPKAVVATNSEATHAAARRLRSTLEQLARSSRFALGHEDPTAYGVG